MAKLKYKDENGFWQELPVGTNVVANPMLTGTEQELTSLQVGNAKYKSGSGGGGKLYQHRIVISKNEIVLTFNIYCSKNTKLTERELNDFQPNIASLSGESGFGAVTMDITYVQEADIFNITISGVINSGGTAAGYSNTLEKPTYTDNILQL